MPLQRDTFELEIFGRHRSIAVEVPAGPSVATDLLPAARALADGAAQAALDRAAEQGRSVSCRAGCGACCRQMVGISAIEAAGLARTVSNLPEARRTQVQSRFAQAVKRLEEVRLLDPKQAPGRRTLRGLAEGGTAQTARETSRQYFSLGIACPFLEDESCSIYAQRPMMCREYNVTSPAERCATVHQGGVEKLTSPLHVGVSLGRTARELLASPIGVMPLTLSLEWAAGNAEAMAMTFDGAALYSTWLKHLGAKAE